MAMALKVLNPDDEFEEILMNLGLSAQDFMSFLESLALDFQVSILTLDDVDETKTRVFSLWERAFMSKETRDFLLSALHNEVLAPAEMEQVLAVLFATAPGFIDMEELYGILENVVEDPDRIAVLGPGDQKTIH
jgi:uncharacterized protein Smg (DUF494 family)